VVFVGNGGSKQGHNAIAEHLVHRAFKAVHRLHHAVNGWVEELLGGFGIEAADEFRRVLEIGKQHRDLLAFAFQGAFGGEDLLGEIRRGVGEGRLPGGFRGSRGSGGSGTSGAGPDKDTIALIPGDLVCIEEFVFEGLQGLVVQVKLHFEGPVGHPPPLAQQGDHLIQDRDKVHRLSSLPGARPSYSCTTLS
jgi:hypothetical protein